MLAALAAVLALLPGAVAASTVTSAVSRGAAVRWTPDDYIRAALQLSPDAISAEASLDAAGARARSRWARAFAPSLDFSAKVSPAKFAPVSRFTFDTWRVNANDVLLTPGLSWNLFNSFQDLLGARSTELSRESAGESLYAARQSQALSALRAYWGYYLREKLLAVGVQNLKVQRAQYDLTLDRYRHGMKSLSDLLKTEVDWRSSELRLETDAASNRLARFGFNILVGADEGAPVELAADLSLGTTVPPLLEEGLRAAMVQRPEMRRNKLQVRQAELAYTLAKIAAGPTASLDFAAAHAWTGDFGARAQPFGAGTSIYGLTLSLSLPGSFNLYSQYNDVRASEADLRVARTSTEAQRRSLRQEVYQAHISLTRALRSLEISGRKEEISRQNLELVSEEYSQGSADVIRLSQAQTDYVSAQAERLQALHDAKIDAAGWELAIGEPIWR
ncbi:MAG: TolC family protein [Elusimicrobia bacterium]|nr:TolC family protein [Elusimicrobiota bacterium]